MIIDPCQNPDGRITDLRANGNGFDCNRDFITLTQPEAVITTNTLRTWLPTTMLDLHGFVDPMLIEPTTIPHNPNLEYDLIISSALPLGRAMKAALEDATGHTGQIPYLWGTAEDVQNDVNEGWDDYGPYYVPQIAQEFGAVAFTLETSSKTTDGVDGHYAVSLESIKYSIDNKWQMLRNQAEFFRRGVESVPDGVTGRPWAGNMTDMIRAAIWNPATQSSVNQDIAWGDPGFPYSNVVGDVAFPYAYVIPVDPSLQRNPLEAYKALNHALAYGLKVEVAKAPFSAGGTELPGGDLRHPHAAGAQEPRQQPSLGRRGCEGQVRRQLHVRHLGLEHALHLGLHPRQDRRSVLGLAEDGRAGRADARGGQPARRRLHGQGRGQDGRRDRHRSRVLVEGRQPLVRAGRQPDAASGTTRWAW